MKVGKSNILCVMKCIISLLSIRWILETNNVLQILICNPFYYIIVKKSANNHEKIYQHFSKKAPNRFFSFLLIFVQKGLNILTMQMVSIGTVENDTFFQGRGILILEQGNGRADIQSPLVGASKLASMHGCYTVLNVL